TASTEVATAAGGGGCATNTPPPATNTPVPPTATATACTATNYVYSVSTGATIVPGTTNIGNNCDDCTSPITLPFPFTLYDTTTSNITAGSNGGLFFSTDNPTFGITCIPNALSTYTIAPFWTDQWTLTTDCATCGIF